MRLAPASCVGDELASHHFSPGSSRCREGRPRRSRDLGPRLAASSRRGAGGLLTTKSGECRTSPFPHHHPDLLTPPPNVPQLQVPKTRLDGLQ